MFSFALCAGRPKSQQATTNEDYRHRRVSRKWLKLIANTALAHQAIYWSNVNNERFHQPY
jgi:hypothetical protein